MNQLKIRFFGGFEVWVDGVRVTGFESYRARSLFAYLACQRDRSFSRGHLSGLLWPERDEQTARRNLRQVLYNVKSQLARDSELPLLLTEDGNLQLNPEIECWLDVEQFQEALERGFGNQSVNIQALARAVGVYRGDFLADFPLKESPELELWILTEQEAYREQVIQALRHLVENYLSRGESRIGVQFAQRLVAIDPLSEQAHRYLIRFYSLSGRRSQAIQAYEDLRQRLETELGAEPLAETRALYEDIRTQDSPAAVIDDGREAIGPLIPMVGRREPHRELGSDWRFVLEGRALITVLAGEAGVGKSRLAKSFLGAVSARRGVQVLKGRCFGRVPRPYQPFERVVRSALLEDPALTESPEELSPQALATFRQLVPELASIWPEDVAVEPEPFHGPLPVPESVAALFERLCRGKGGEDSSEPLIVFVEDLHHASAETFELLDQLVRRLKPMPLWILVTCDPGAANEQLEVSLLARRAEDSTVNVVLLERLSPVETEEIALALVPENQAAQLAQLLDLRGGGLPLHNAELINVLWGEGGLTLEGEGRWRLAENASESLPADTDLEDLVASRLRRLPNSARRLAALAAVIGPTFESDLLEAAGDEHPTVIGVALELMLERWLARKSTGGWVTSSPEQDISRWNLGARHGRFEFSHEVLWQSVYGSVNPLRQQVMHREVATALLKLGERDGIEPSEAIASHSAAAGEWQMCWPAAERAAARAHSLGAEGIADHYFDLALRSLSALASGSGSRLDRERWQREKDRIETELDRVRSPGGEVGLPNAG